MRLRNEVIVNVCLKEFSWLLSPWYRAMTVTDMLAKHKHVTSLQPARPTVCPAYLTFLSIFGSLTKTLSDLVLTGEEELASCNKNRHIDVACAACSWARH